MFEREYGPAYLFWAIVIVVSVLSVVALAKGW